MFITSNLSAIYQIHNIDMLMSRTNFDKMKAKKATNIIVNDSSLSHLIAPEKRFTF